MLFLLSAPGAHNLTAANAYLKSFAGLQRCRTNSIEHGGVSFCRWKCHLCMCCMRTPDFGQLGWSTVRVMRTQHGFCERCVTQHHVICARTRIRRVCEGEESDVSMKGCCAVLVSVIAVHFSV